MRCGGPYNKARGRSTPTCPTLASDLGEGVQGGFVVGRQAVLLRPFARDVRVVVGKGAPVCRDEGGAHLAPVSHIVAVAAVAGQISVLTTEGQQPSSRDKARGLPMCVVVTWERAVPISTRPKESSSNF